MRGESKIRKKTDDYVIDLTYHVKIILNTVLLNQNETNKC